MSEQHDAAGDAAVFQGFWVERDRGNSLGATLTLQDGHAIVLLAFMALLTTYVGTRSWLFWRFLLHNVIGDRNAHAESSQSTVYLQVILRNAETASGALWGLVVAALPSNKSRQDPQRRFWLGLFTAGNVVAFIAAGILASQLVVGRRVVSTITDTCGMWRNIGLTSTLDYDQYALQLELQRNATVDADNYVRNCHGNRGMSRQILSCGKFVTRELALKTELVAECPFSGGLCLTGNSSFAVDSGNISFADLGINSRFAKSLSVRRRSVCAPLPAAPFRFEQNASANSTASAFTTYRFAKLKGEWLIHYLQHPRTSVDYDLQSYYFLNNSGSEIVPSLRPVKENRLVSVILLSGTGITFRFPNVDRFSRPRREYNTRQEWFPKTTPATRWIISLASLAATKARKFAARSQAIARRGMIFTT
jgi:hypothetical protein